MTIYPVLIPTLNRYNHLVNCVESLSKCSLASQTELVIGVDYPPTEKYVDGYKQICNYIPNITGFGKVTFFYHKKNLGPVGNSTFLKNYCFSKYDALIYTEDDNVFAPNFLDFMNKTLNLFANDDRISSVSGYSPANIDSTSSYTAYLSKDNNAWGMGVWKNKEQRNANLLNDDQYFKSVLRSPLKGRKIIKTYPMLYLMLHIMVRDHENWGDAKRATMNIIENKFQLRPICSLVRNNGFDGSGVHCGNSVVPQQDLNDNLWFDFSVDLKENQYVVKELYEQLLPKNEEDRNKTLNRIYNTFLNNINPLKYYHIGRRFRNIFGIIR